MISGALCILQERYDGYFSLGILRSERLYQAPSGVPSHQSIANNKKSIKGLHPVTQQSGLMLVDVGWCMVVVREASM